MLFNSHFCVLNLLKIVPVYPTINYVFHLVNYNKFENKEKENHKIEKMEDE